ncbi:hypothetical protein Vafri_21146 [Volvox africanus]|uniref:Uncharacterized protein n=1 Tax=Volvox africanus TaxID=51714 RepID=A0A8J4BTN5_9CHLO|nr:hypothetical protein Vafri_21146 [Volvox africanus]
MAMTFQSSSPSSIMARTPSGLTLYTPPRLALAVPISTTSTGSLSPCMMVTQISESANVSSRQTMCVPISVLRRTKWTHRRRSMRLSRGALTSPPIPTGVQIRQTTCKTRM